MAEILLSPDFQGVKQATAIINPYSSTALQAQRRLRRFTEAAKPYFEVCHRYTQRDPKYNSNLIRGEAEESDLLVVVAGDGTVNLVVNELTDEELPSEVRFTPVASLGGGNADDGHKAKHPKGHRRNPEWILEDGLFVPTYPIRCEITKSDDTRQQRSAAFYASFGVTGLMASPLYLNRPEHRGSLVFGRNKVGRAISEPILATRALLRAREHVVIHNGVEETIFGDIFAKSHIMAKYGRLATHLTKREINRVTVRYKRLLQIAPAIGKLVRGKMPGEYLRGQDTHDFETTDELWAEFDGEAMLLEPGTKVSVGIHREPIYVVTTNPELC
ncbi:MAG TPA: diacylglycerol kinase family protein [Candidatus Saccharimonadales bacterium]|nr:diacylglycerol kinase family protein [Candidatus Saccharimonadales bacterium]